MNMRHLFVACALALGSLPGLASAETLLTVITPGADGGKVTHAYSREELAKAFPQVTVVTANDYSDGTRTFVGPRLRDVFAGITLKPEDQISLVALNDYAVKIPASDAIKYDVILATTLDGKEMTVRDKGPVWVIYPMSAHAELREPSYNDRLVWQLSKVELLPSH